MDPWLFLGQFPIYYQTLSSGHSEIPAHLKESSVSKEENVKLEIYDNVWTEWTEYARWFYEPSSKKENLQNYDFTHFCQFFHHWIQLI